MPHRGLVLAGLSGRHKTKLRRLGEVFAILVISRRTVSNWVGVKSPHPRYLVGPANASGTVTQKVAQTRRGWIEDPGSKD